jgi:hypothetical protein
MTRLRLELELKLSTRFPQSPAIVDNLLAYVENVSVISVTRVSPRFDGLEGQGRLGASGAPRTQAEHRAPPLTEPELIAAHGGLRALRDDDRES